MCSRPFLSRLILAGSGMLLLCLAAIIGLGWVVREPANWSLNMLGLERWFRLHGAGTCALGALLPADSDGDGFPDSVEWYLHFDRHNPRSHPFVSILDQAAPGFVASEMVPKLQERNLCFLVEPGERRRIHARVGIDELPAVFARGMHMFVHAANNFPREPGSSVEPVVSLLCLPGGTPTSGLLLVPVASDGSMEFDMVVPVTAKTADDRRGYVISVDYNAWASSTNNTLVFGVVRRQDPLSFTNRELPRVRVAGWSGAIHKGPMVRLEWEPPNFSGPYLIEATRDETGREWFPVTVCPAENQEAVISYELNDSKPGHGGPLQFRVIPTKLLGTKE